MSTMDQYPVLRVMDTPALERQLRVTDGKDVAFKGWLLAEDTYKASHPPIGEHNSVAAYRTVGGTYLLHLYWWEGSRVCCEVQRFATLEALIAAVPLTTVGKRLLATLGEAPVERID